MRFSDDFKRGIVLELDGLDGRDRSDRVTRLATWWGISKQAISTWCRKAGRRDGRTVRRDRGRSALTDDHLTAIAGTVNTSKRLDGSMIMPVCDAAEMLQQRGACPEVSRSTIYRELRRRDRSVRHLLKPAPFQYRSTAHPNEEMQLDATNCVQYFLDTGGLGEREIAMELHKNHPREFRKIRRELLRYAIVDHHSGMFWFQYYYAAGESASDTLDFFCHAIQPKGHHAYQFHGVPRRLFVDRGSLARAKMSTTLLGLLDVDLVSHLPGNPRAKGLVEWVHRFLLRFEARLKLRRPASLEELNRWAWEYAVKICVTRPYRQKTDPRGLTRQQRWLTITPEQLRIPQPADVLKRMVNAGTQPRTVDVGGRFTYDGLLYRMPDTNAWGERITVHYNPYESGRAVVATWTTEDGAIRGQWRCQPLRARPDGWLEDTSLPGTIRRPAATATQRAMPELEAYAQETYGIRWKGAGDKRYAVAPPLGEHKDSPFGADLESSSRVVTPPKAGTPHEVRDPAAERRLTVMGLLGELSEMLGRALTREENARIRAAWPAGCRMDQVDDVMDQVTGGELPRPDTEEERHGTSAVGQAG